MKSNQNTQITHVLGVIFTLLTLPIILGGLCWGMIAVISSPSSTAAQVLGRLLVVEAVVLQITYFFYRTMVNTGKEKYSTFIFREEQFAPKVMLWCAYYLGKCLVVVTTIWEVRWALLHQFFRPNYTDVLVAYSVGVLVTITIFCFGPSMLARMIGRIPPPTGQETERPDEKWFGPKRPSAMR